MSNVEVVLEEIDGKEDPYAVLTFGKNGKDAVVKVTLSFEGDWLALFENHDVSEDEARHGFAGELFAAITNLF